jgi:hypothetical protein
LPIPPSLTRTPAARVVLAVGLGAAGGALFAYLRAPLPWMIGASAITTAAALAGAPIHVPRRSNAVVVPVLGVMLGSAFTPETLADLAGWWPSVIALLLYAALMAGVFSTLLRRRFGFGAASAYFSSVPGGNVAMYTVGTAMGGDARTISLIHNTRALLTVITIPFWFRLFQGYEPAGFAVPGPAANTIGLDDALVLGVCAVLGFWVANLARVPAPFLIGPMLLSAAAHVTGLTDASPPGILVAIAQVLIGTSMGCRFTGVSIRDVANLMAIGAVMGIVMMLVAAAAAGAISHATGLSFAALLLAFAPGGLAEMALISLALGIDTAFVSTHHLIRLSAIMLFAPVFFRIVETRLGSGNESKS